MAIGTLYPWQEIVYTLAMSTGDTGVCQHWSSAHGWTSGSSDAHDAALLVLLSATALSIYKPWGRVTISTRSGLPYVLLAILAVVLMFVVLHHLTGGLRGH
jgi:hypothetical protein